MSQQKYHPIVEAIWNDLCDRSGFDLDCLDSDAQKEIKDTWHKLVKENEPDNVEVVS